MQHPCDLIYSPKDLVFEDYEGDDGPGDHRIEGACSLFSVELLRSELRPHASAICDSKHPDEGTTQLLMLIFYVIDNISLCNIVTGNSEDADPNEKPFFNHPTRGKLPRVDVFYEHMFHDDFSFSVGLRYTFVVYDPTVDIAIGISEVIKRNQRDRAALMQKAARSERRNIDGEIVAHPPWEAHKNFFSVHDVAQLIDRQKSNGLPEIVDDERNTLGLELYDVLNPANPMVSLGYLARYSPSDLRSNHNVDPATGLHSLSWPLPWNRNVVHIANKFYDPEIAFSLPFASIWTDTPRLLHPQSDRLEATVRLRKRKDFQYKESTDLEHLKKEVEIMWKCNTGDKEYLRSQCENKFWQVINSGASRLPMVVKKIIRGACEDESKYGSVTTRIPPIPTQPAGLDTFGRWLIQKFNNIQDCGGIVAHLAHFFRMDLVAYCALRRGRKLIAPVLISRGIRGSGKSEQREQCICRHRNAKRAGYKSAKSLYVSDRDALNEEYFPMVSFIFLFIFKRFA